MNTGDLKSRINIIFFVGMLIFCSCNGQQIKYQQQIVSTQKLLDYFMSNDTAKVRSLIGIKSRYLSEDLSGLAFKVNLASNLINKYGIPSKDKFVIKEYPSNDYQQVDIIIPMFEGQDKELREVYITVSFFKYLPPEKIASFDIRTERDRGLILAPDSLSN
jgi:hypothetical protein